MEAIKCAKCGATVNLSNLPEWIQELGNKNPNDPWLCDSCQREAAAARFAKLAATAEAEEASTPADLTIG
jgi:hypothetical protein